VFVLILGTLSEVVGEDRGIVVQAIIIKKRLFAVDKRYF